MGILILILSLCNKTPDHNKLPNEMGCTHGNDELREWELDIDKIVLHSRWSPINNTKSK